MVVKIGIVLLLLAVVLILLAVMGKKPYANLKTEGIVSASVALTPPGRTVQIINIEELVEYLNSVEIYNKDNSYADRLLEESTDVSFLKFQ